MALDRNATSMPHVCIVSCSHHANDFRVTHKVGRSFADAGFRVTWVGPDGKMPDQTHGICFRTYRRPARRLGRLFNYRRAYSLCRREVRDADVYFAVEPDSATVCNRLARRFGARSVFDVHEIYDQYTLGYWTRSEWLRQVLGRIVLRRLARTASGCDLLVGVNDAVLLPFSGLSTLRMVVRNFAPLDFCTHVDVAQRNRGDQLRFMHGKSSADRGTIEVLEALGRLKQTLPNPPHVVCFREYIAIQRFAETEFQEAVRARGITDLIEMQDQVPFRQVPDVLARCDAGLVVLSKERGQHCLANRLGEYLAAGLAVIVPEYSPDMAGIVRDAECGLAVNCEDLDAISDAMTFLCENPEETRRMGRNGRQAFLDQCNWEAEVQPLVEWIRGSA